MDVDAMKTVVHALCSVLSARRLSMCVFPADPAGHCSRSTAPGVSSMSNGHKYDTVNRVNSITKNQLAGRSIAGMMGDVYTSKGRKRMVAYPARRSD